MAVVLQVNVKRQTGSERGLPKVPVDSARVDAHGFEGDFNRYRHEKLGDEPTSAVLIVPRETIEELQREGWPVRPGDLGENLTTRGIPYQELRPGVVFRVGSAEVEVTRPCEPCTNLYELPYIGPEKGPRFLKAMVGRRGWYAKVNRPGVIHAGDELVRREPATDSTARGVTSRDPAQRPGTVRQPRASGEPDPGVGLVHEANR